MYNCLPADDPLGSEHVEDVKKLKIKILEMCILFIYIV
jgi:hypothetical protein